MKAYYHRRAPEYDNWWQRFLAEARRVVGELGGEVIHAGRWFVLVRA